MDFFPSFCPFSLVSLRRRPFRHMSREVHGSLEFLVRPQQSPLREGTRWSRPFRKANPRPRDKVPLVRYLPRIPVVPSPQKGTGYPNYPSIPKRYYVTLFLLLYTDQNPIWSPNQWPIWWLIMSPNQWSIWSPNWRSNWSSQVHWWPKWKPILDVLWPYCWSYKHRWQHWPRN